MHNSRLHTRKESFIFTGTAGRNIVSCSTGSSASRGPSTDMLKRRTICWHGKSVRRWCLCIMKYMTLSKFCPTMRTFVKVIFGFKLSKATTCIQGYALITLFQGLCYKILFADQNKISVHIQKAGYQIGVAYLHLWSSDQDQTWRVPAPIDGLKDHTFVCQSQHGQPISTTMHALSAYPSWNSWLFWGLRSYVKKLRC